MMMVNARGMILEIAVILLQVSNQSRAIQIFKSIIDRFLTLHCKEQPA